MLAFSDLATKRLPLLIRSPEGGTVALALGLRPKYKGVDAAVWLLELTPREDHAQYIASWLRVLKGDKRAVFTAASKAQQAADYLIRQSERTAEVAA